MRTCIQMECFMPYFALIIMYYHVKIACYQFAHIVKFLVTKSILDHWSRHQNNTFFHELNHIFGKNHGYSILGKTISSKNVYKRRSKEIF